MGQFILFWRSNFCQSNFLGLTTLQFGIPYRSRLVKLRLLGKLASGKDHYFFLYW